MADYFLGFDLSTQQLKAIIVDADLKLIHEAKVDFDADFGAKYGIEKGVLTNPAEGEVFAPVALFLDAVDLVLQRLREKGVEFDKVRGVSGAGMQHGTVFWSERGEELLGGLKAEGSLVEQLKGAFSSEWSPNWQDASTQTQVEAFNKVLGGSEELARVTGSSAHHRFSGPQIMRFRQKFPDKYAATARISLVSSFLASLFLGRIAPIDISDATGTNLWDIRNGGWHPTLLSLASPSNLHIQLGAVPLDSHTSLGAISPYFTTKYGFSPSTLIFPFTGDNPSTILALPLRPSDAIVSLGTSTTFLMSTPAYKPSPEYHVMNHPTTPGNYMFMLCYKNGGLAREHVRDALNAANNAQGDKSWDLFNVTALTTPALGSTPASNTMRLGLFFPRPEIVPAVKAGTWRFEYNPATSPTGSAAVVTPTTWPAHADPRAILESQLLSLRLRSTPLLLPQGELPPQPRRIYLVGGGSANPTIAALAGSVLGGAEGVYRLEIGPNACALGSAYRAAWGILGDEEEAFEDWLGERWDEGVFVKKVDEGYREGVFERYGEGVEGLRWVEGVVQEEGRGWVARGD